MEYHLLNISAGVAITDVVGYQFLVKRVPASLNKVEILDLTRGEYLQKHQSIIFLGNPVVGKNHLATSIDQAACRQKRQSAFLDGHQPGQ